MIRLVVSDIDGTLIHTTDGPVPAAVFEQISRLRAKGIIFAPASGRQYRSLRRLFAPLAGELHYICENGAVVFGPGSPGAVLSKVVMEHGEAMALARKIVETPDCELFMSGTNTSYLCPKGPEIVTLMRDRVRNNVVLLERPETPPAQRSRGGHHPWQFAPGCMLSRAVTVIRWGFPSETREVERAPVEAL